MLNRIALVLLHPFVRYAFWFALAWAWMGISMAGGVFAAFWAFKALEQPKEDLEEVDVSMAQKVLTRIVVLDPDNWNANHIRSMRYDANQALKDLGD